MSRNPITWFEIYTSDFERAKKFYTDVFKLEITDLPISSDNHSEMRYATFEANQEGWGASGALAKIDAAKPGPGGTMVYFSTEEINDELRRVESAGGKVIQQKQSIGGEYGFMALIQDTEGNIIGLHSMK